MRKPVKLIELGTSPQDFKSKFKLHENNIQNILMNDEVKNRKVAIISIAGQWHFGKSFLLNYILRFLYTNVSHVPK